MRIITLKTLRLFWEQHSDAQQALQAWYRDAVREALPLCVREWECPDCGAHRDRDMNAERNLRKIAVSSTVKACGKEGAGLDLAAKVKSASVKQESNIEATYA